MNIAARLPKQLEEHDTLEELPVGKTMWTVPWAMKSYGLNGCYLSAGFTSSCQGGTVQLRVTRQSDGYHVFLPNNYKYEISDGFPSQDDIPVTSITIEDRSYF